MMARVDHLCLAGGSVSTCLSLEKIGGGVVAGLDLAAGYRLLVAA